MATTQELAELRASVNETANEEPYTDAALAALIDSMGVRAAAGSIWRRKAASVADLVDISEGGSSRKMSELRKSYLEMADLYDPTFDGKPEPLASSAPRTRAIERA